MQSDLYCMKKILCFLVLGFLSLQIYAQNQVVSPFGKNEFGIDVLDFAILRAFDVSYEHVGNPLGYGITFHGNPNSDDLWDIGYCFTPFVRYYFFNPKGYSGCGFYADGALKMFKLMRYSKKGFDMAFTIGLGIKVVSQKGIFLDFTIGAGRPFGLANHYSQEIVLCGGMVFGCRF